MSNKKEKVSRSKVPRKMMFAVLFLAVVLSLYVGLVVGYYYGFIYGSHSSQMTVWDMIARHERELRGLYDESGQLELEQWLPHTPMNFTDGLIWESNLNFSFSYDMPPYENVTQTLKNGEGACGEFALVYGAFCVANDIPFRIMHVGFILRALLTILGYR